MLHYHCTSYTFYKGFLLWQNIMIRTKSVIKIRSIYPILTFLFVQIHKKLILCLLCDGKRKICTDGVLTAMRGIQNLFSMMARHMPMGIFISDTPIIKF